MCNSLPELTFRVKTSSYIQVYTIIGDNMRAVIDQYLLIIIPVNHSIYYYIYIYFILYCTSIPHISKVYWSRNHSGCWNDTRKACQSLAFGSWITVSSRVLPTSQVVYWANKLNHRNMWHMLLKTYPWVHLRSINTNTPEFQPLMIQELRSLESSIEPLM